MKVVEKPSKQAKSPRRVCKHRWGPWGPDSEAPLAIMGCLKQKSICKQCDQERYRQFDLD